MQNFPCPPPDNILSNADCRLEDKRKDYQNCSAVLCTSVVRYAHTQVPYEQLLKLTVVCWFRFSLNLGLFVLFCHCVLVLFAVVVQQVAVWRSGNALVSINEVNLR